MRYQRRSILHTFLHCTSLAALGGGSFLAPSAAMARWPDAAFTSPDMAEAVQHTLGNTVGIPSNDVIIDAPEYIKEPSVVELTVSTGIPNVSAIAILISENLLPLAALHTLTEDTQPFIITRLDIEQTSEVIAVVKSGEQLFSNRHRIKVLNMPNPTLNSLDAELSG